MAGIKRKYIDLNDFALHISDLPNETFLHGILPFLDVESLKAVRATCRWLRNLASLDLVWKPHYERAYELRNDVMIPLVKLHTFPLCFTRPCRQANHYEIHESTSRPEPMIIKRSNNLFFHLSNIEYAWAVQNYVRLEYKRGKRARIQFLPINFLNPKICWHVRDIANMDGPSDS